MQSGQSKQTSVSRALISWVDRFHVHINFHVRYGSISTYDWTGKRTIQRYRSCSARWPIDINDFYFNTYSRNVSIIPAR